MGKNSKFWVRVRFCLDSSSMELESCFRGGHQLLINCNCKHQLIDWKQRSLGWYLNSVSLSKVKCLVYCEMCGCSDNFIQWKNHRVRTTTFGFAFCSVLYGVRFGFLLIFFYFRVRVPFGSWQNLGSGSVRSCWVRVLSHLYKHGSPYSPSPVYRRFGSVSMRYLPLLAVLAVCMLLSIQ